MHPSESGSDGLDHVTSTMARRPSRGGATIDVVGDRRARYYPPGGAVRRSRLQPCKLLVHPATSPPPPASAASAAAPSQRRGSLGSLVARASDLRLNGREFDPGRPPHYRSVGTGMGDRLRAGIPPRYVTSHPGQLSLLPSVGKCFLTDCS